MLGRMPELRAASWPRWGSTVLCWADGPVLMGDTGWTLVQSRDQETGERHQTPGEGRRDQGWYGLGHALRATLRRAVWLQGTERQGGRPERGRVAGLRQREQWPGQGAGRDMFQFQSGVEGRVGRTRRALQMREVGEAKAPPGLGRLTGQWTIQGATREHC